MLPAPSAAATLSTSLLALPDDTGTFTFPSVVDCVMSHGIRNTPVF